jgi:hypothetical protein
MEIEALVPKGFPKTEKVFALGNVQGNASVVRGSISMRGEEAPHRVGSGPALEPCKMANVTHAGRFAPTHGTFHSDESLAHQAYQLLHWGFVAAPFLAGADKFFGFMTHWEKYLATPIANLSPFSAHGTMLVVGLIEMAAAVVVAIRPRVGAYVVAGWLALIILNLLMVGGYLDVALRDLGLCIGALALGRLSAGGAARARA